jgi:hypothetical protein
LDIWPIVIAVAFVFMIVFLVTESAQNYLYDQVVDGLWWRALLAAAILGFAMAKFPLQLDNIYEQSIWPILGQAALWFLVFWLACRYQLGHGFAVGVLIYLITVWFYSIAMSSLAKWMSGAGAA